MTKYSLGVDDAAGVRLQCFTLAKELHARDAEPASVSAVIADAEAIEKFLFAGKTADEKEEAEALKAR